MQHLVLLALLLDLHSDLGIRIVRFPNANPLRVLLRNAILGGTHLGLDGLLYLDSDLGLRIVRCPIANASLTGDTALMVRCDGMVELKVQRT